MKSGMSYSSNSRIKASALGRDKDESPETTNFQLTHVMPLRMMESRGPGNAYYTYTRRNAPQWNSKIFGGMVLEFLNRF